MAADGDSEVRLVADHSFHTEYRCGRTTAWIDWTAGGVVLTTVSGPGVVALAQPIVDGWERVRRQTQPVVLLLDFSQMAVYDGEFRRQLTAWAQEWRPQLKQIEVFTRSKLVAMGATVANLALGGNLIRIYAEPGLFDAQVRSAGLSPRR